MIYRNDTPNEANMFFDDIFKNKSPNYDKLINFGFVFNDNTYIFSRHILDNQFDLVVEIPPTPHCQVLTRVIDLDTGDEYRLHLVDSAVGIFVGKVRTECLNILSSIADNCFETAVFKNKNTQQIIAYTKEKYQDNLEYLWSKFPEYAVLRRKDNQKWYAVIMVVKKDKIGLTGDGKIEIMNVRGEPEEIKNIIDGKKFFPAYHMNKKSWVTIGLESSLEVSEIIKRLDKSYILAKKTTTK